MADKHRSYYIPPNYQNKINLLGFISVSYSNLIQGVILGGVPLLLFVLYVKTVEWNNSFLTIGILMFFAGFIPGVVGVYNASLLSFLKIYSNYRKHKRLTVYNPRVKSEIVSADYSNIKEQMLLPKDRIRIWMEERKQNKITEETRKMQEQLDSFNVTDAFYFEEDEGVVDKPYEYMTAKERKVLAKQERKEEKERLKHEKKERQKKVKEDRRKK